MLLILIERGEGRGREEGREERGGKEECERY